MREQFSANDKINILLLQTASNQRCIVKCLCVAVCIVKNLSTKFVLSAKAAKVVKTCINIDLHHRESSMPLVMSADVHITLTS